MTDTVISATMVNDLRQQTGAGLMDCKKALVEAKGNVEVAIDLLRKKGLASAAKKADRAAKDGLIVATISSDAKSGVLLMISCETDFVAKTDNFKDFCKSIAEHILANNPADIDALHAQTFKPTGTSVKDALAATIGKLGENMAIRSFRITRNDSGAFVEQYIHLGGKVGVLLTLNFANEATASKPELKTLAKDICMHIAASSPVAINRSEIDPALVAKEKEIIADQAKGKPAAAIEKIISGKLDKFYAQSCLLEQPFVKNPDITIKALVEETGKKLGDTISIKSFSRLQVGA